MVSTVGTVSALVTVFPPFEIRCVLSALSRVNVWPRPCASAVQTSRLQQSVATGRRIEGQEGGSIEEAVYIFHRHKQADGAHVVQVRIARHADMHLLVMTLLPLEGRRDNSGANLGGEPQGPIG